MGLILLIILVVLLLGGGVGYVGQGYYGGYSGPGIGYNPNTTQPFTVNNAFLVLVGAYT